VFPNENIFYVEENPRAIEWVNTGTPAGLTGNHDKTLGQLAKYCSDLKETTAGQAKPPKRT
jgi:hypothetical protein